MSIVITLLTVFLVMVSILLVLITLMQRPKQEGLGAAFGGGMMNDTFGAQTTDVLQKSTVWLTVAFFGTAILLTILNTRHFENERNVGNILEGVQQPKPMPSFPTPDAIPPADSSEATPKPAPAKSEPVKKNSNAAPKAEPKKAPQTPDPAKPAKPADTKKPAAKTESAKGKADAPDSSAGKKKAE